MNKLLSAGLMASMIVAACAKDPGKDAPKAEVKAAVEEKKAPAAAGKTEALEIAADASTVEFVGAKITAQHAGKFEQFAGKIDLVDDATKSKVTFEVKTA